MLELSLEGFKIVLDEVNFGEEFLFGRVEGIFSVQKLDDSAIGISHGIVVLNL